MLPTPRGRAAVIDTTPASSLSRVLGFWEVTASGVGVIVGAGIYVLVGEATAQAGAGVWIAFLIAAVLSALTALSYAELASMFPKSSAEYEYTRQAFPIPVAFVVGWVMIAGLAVGAAAVSLGFAHYFREFSLIDKRVIAIGLLVAVTIIALGGIRNSARVTLAFSAVQVGGLLLVIAIGFDHIGDVNLLQTTGASGVLGAAALVFFAFIGFDEVITLSEETRNPTRTIPRALLTALAVSAVLYALVAVVAVSVLGSEELGNAEAPLADVVGHAWPNAREIVAVVAMVSTFNTTLLLVTASSRLSYGMASGGALPSVLARLNRRRAPWLAITAMMAVAAAFASLGDLTLIAGVTDAAVYLVFLAVNATLIVLRRTRPNAPRPFAVKGTVRTIPVLPVFGLLATLVMLTQLEWRSLALGGALIAAGLLAFWLISPSGKRTE